MDRRKMKKWRRKDFEPKIDKDLWEKYTNGLKRVHDKLKGHKVLDVAADAVFGIYTDPISTVIHLLNEDSPSWDSYGFFMKKGMDVSIEERHFYSNMWDVRNNRKRLKEARDAIAEKYPVERYRAAMTYLVRAIIKQNARMNEIRVGSIQYDPSFDGLHIRWAVSQCKAPGNRSRTKAYGETVDVIIGRSGYRIAFERKLNPACDKVDAVIATRVIAEGPDWYRADFAGSKDNYPVHFTGTARLLKDDTYSWKVTEIEKPYRTPRIGEHCQ